MAQATTRPSGEPALRRLLVLILVLAAAPATACPQGGKRKDRAMTYAEAVALLRSSETMCQGAEALAKLGNKAALGPLLDAHSSAEESAVKQCVKRAMEALGARSEARRLAAAAAATERHAGLALMGMFKGDQHLPVLARLLDGDPDAAVRAHAVEVLWLQKRTGPWEPIMLKALDHSDAAVRRTAAQALTGQYGPAVLAALRKRLSVEKEAAVRDKLTAAIREHESHASPKR